VPTRVRLIRVGLSSVTTQPWALAAPPTLACLAKCPSSSRGLDPPSKPGAREGGQTGPCASAALPWLPLWRRPGLGRLQPCSAQVACVWWLQRRQELETHLCFGVFALPRLRRTCSLWRPHECLQPHPASPEGLPKDHRQGECPW
jgi:hypothetical protein